MTRLLLRFTVALTIAAAVCAQQWLSADSPAGSKRRCLPPKWDARVTDEFFPDAQATLEGPRPKNFGAPAAVAGGGAANGGNPAAGGATGSPAAGGQSWSKLISSDTLQDEIKSYQNSLRDDVKTPADFKATGFKKARDDFSMLAVAFGVIGQYDGDARWKDQAPAAREVFARAGMNCKVATDQSFNEARTCADDLAALIRGDTLPATAPADATPNWSKLVNRPPLMHRLDLADTNRLTPWTSNAADFAKHQAAIEHEAQIIAAIARVIQDEGFDSADDAAYQGFARDVQRHALELVAAAQSKNLDAARAANVAISKSCDSCHHGFR